jgi:hypothetical protein
MVKEGICPKCSGKGFIFSGEKFVQCGCQVEKELREYLRPLKQFAIGLGLEGKKPVELEDRVQAVVKGAENILGVIQYIGRKWFPGSYDTVSPVRLNYIGFGNDSEYKTIGEYARAFDYYIIDMSLMDKARINEPKVKSKDDMYLLELIRDMKGHEGKAIIVIDERVTTFLKKNVELCSGLAELGVPYWDKGKYREFTKVAWE